MDRVDARLRKVFGDLFRIDPTSITDDMRRGEMDGWDSLAHLDLVSQLESEFGVSIDTEQALEIETFADARRLLETRPADA